MKIYTDGSTTRIAYVIPHPLSVEHVITKIVPLENKVTVNEGEYIACITALEAAKAEGATVVELLSDSQLIVRQVTGVYKCRVPSLKLYLDAVKRLVEDFEQVTFKWLPRESNIAGWLLE